jgi:hypothetical protein
MTTTNVEDFSLQNIENFHSNFNSSKDEIFEKYNTLFSDYFIFMFENLQVKKSTFLKFIIQRGLLTVTNVFNFILYYSKNLELAYYHGQKAFYFYIEYIGQISEDHHTFLQLSSRDATMFVYKKTIFDIHNEFKKAVSQNEKSVFDGLEIVQFLQKTVMNTVLERFNFKSNERNNEIKYHLNNIAKLLQHIIEFKFSENDLNIIKLFFEKSFMIENMNFEFLYQKLELFLKRYNDVNLKKFTITKDTLKMNILHSDIEEFFTKDTKFLTLFSKEL